MKIPKIISKNGRKYEYVKVYPNYIQWQSVDGNSSQAKTWYDLITK